MVIDGYTYGLLIPMLVGIWGPEKNYGEIYPFVTGRRIQWNCGKENFNFGSLKSKTSAVNHSSRAIGASLDRVYPLPLGSLGWGYPCVDLKVSVCFC